MPPSDTATSPALQQPLVSHANIRTTGWLDRKQANALNFFRLIFATIVLFSHNWILGGFGTEPLATLFSHIGGSAGCAVNGFFCISGFLIMGSWDSRPDTDSYLRARIVRIWPAFAIAFIASAVIASMAAGSEWLHYLQSIPKQSWVIGIFTLNGFELDRALSFANNPYPKTVNGSMWTIPIEFGCYLAVALAGSIGVFRRRWLVSIFSIFAICLAAYEEAFVPNAWMHWPRFAAFFGTGALLYLFRRHIPQKGILALACVAFICASKYLSYYFTLPLAGTYLIFYAAYSAPEWMKRIGAKNDISYGVYLYAFPLQQLLFSCFVRIGHPIAPWVSFAIVLPLSFAFGWLSWIFVEKPAKRWLR